jgi:cyclic pyranopterin phosphate synthase
MPEEGIHQISHDDILKFEEIHDIVRTAVKYGITKVRLTGGEPLVRKGVVDLVGMLSEIPGIEDLALTTNGILLDKYAQALKDAGLKRVNVSLDTIDPDSYTRITRGGKVEEVFRGIEAAKSAGLLPVKVNCVIKGSSQEEDAKAVAKYCLDHGLEIRYIHQMDLESGYFTTVKGGDGGNCASCNRLRLTANGRFKPCLFNDMEFDIRKIGVEEAIRQAIGLKPEKGTKNCSGHFFNIGG